jgi:hypothetical protein
LYGKGLEREKRKIIDAEDYNIINIPDLTSSIWAVG